MGRQTLAVLLGSALTAAIVLAPIPTQAAVSGDVGAPAFSILDASADEGAGSMTFTVELSPVAPSPESVHYSTANESATSGSDYTAVGDTVLNFPANDAAETFTVPLTDDSTDEVDETILANLNTPSDGTIIADAQATGTILDDDGPELSSLDAINHEGDSGKANAQFQGLLSSSSPQDVTFDYTTVAGTATPGSDFVATSDTVTVPAGDSGFTIVIPVKGDRVDEPDETYTLEFSNIDNATEGEEGTGTILDDDPTPHGRGTTLKLRNHLMAKGRVKVPDGFAACKNKVSVRIQRKKPARWVTVKTLKTAPDGSFSVNLPDRKGKYRALAQQLLLPDGDDGNSCLKAISAKKKHVH